MKRDFILGEIEGVAERAIERAKKRRAKRALYQEQHRRNVAAGTVRTYSRYVRAESVIPALLAALEESRSVDGGAL